MIQRLNPEGVPKPASNYAQAVLHNANAKRLVISGQVGITPEGKILENLEDQLEQCWQNIFAVLKGAGFEKKHLVKTTIYVTVPDHVSVSRRVRDEALEGLLVASTYLEISGLASPALLCEIEGEAVKED